MAIPYQSAKFKSANILIIAIWGSTAKFNSRQYFQLYSVTFTAQWTLYSSFRIKEGAVFTTVSMSNPYCHIQ